MHTNNKEKKQEHVNSRNEISERDQTGEIDERDQRRNADTPVSCQKMYSKIVTRRTAEPSRIPKTRNQNQIALFTEQYPHSIR